ncbi:MAG: hypothetical protein GY938_18370 [Ketobacter sp.]|nr:hypothetical protein [Ketobacter sp.]
MNEITPHQVMTEVALAMAMAFFCMMVLALVSLGVRAPPAQPKLFQVEQQAIQTTKASKQSADMGSKWVIYHHGDFFDQDLKPIDPVELNQTNVLMAVSPELNLQQLMSAQSQISSRNVSIALLDKGWLSRLEEMP